jgi:predicted aminopeptidase
LKKVTNEKPRRFYRKWLIVMGLLMVVVGVSGCHTLGFYGQAAKGQYQIFAHQESIAKLSAQPDTPAQLKQRFELLANLRQFARTELNLPTDKQYQNYVDVHRPFVVWNVEAAPEFSTEPKTWWYPLLGSLEYRGYFSKAGATNYAAYLRDKGYDVSVGGVGAYSTLGWFKDPVLNTFIFEDDAELAEIIFHELGHQRVFARGDTDFNEAFATTVGQEGARRWLKARGDEALLKKYLAHLRHSDQFVHLVLGTRARLQTLYGDQVTADGKIKAAEKKSRVSEQELRRQKQEILDGMLAEFARLKTDWNGDSDYDGWFKHPINNSHLNSVAAYYDYLPAFEQILAANGGDMEKFYAAVEQLMKKPKSARHEELRALARTRLGPARAQRPQDLARAAGR